MKQTNKTKRFNQINTAKFSSKISNKLIINNGTDGDDDVNANEAKPYNRAKRKVQKEKEKKRNDGN